MAVLGYPVRNRLDRVHDLPRVGTVGSRPNFDVSASVHIHDASVGSGVHYAVSRGARAQPRWHRAEPARISAIGDVVDVDDDQLAVSLVGYAY